MVKIMELWRTFFELRQPFQRWCDHFEAATKILSGGEQFGAAVATTLSCDEDFGTALQVLEFRLFRCGEHFGPAQPSYVRHRVSDIDGQSEDGSLVS